MGHMTFQRTKVCGGLNQVLCALKFESQFIYINFCLYIKVLCAAYSFKSITYYTQQPYNQASIHMYMICDRVFTFEKIQFCLIKWLLFIQKLIVSYICRSSL